MTLSLTVQVSSIILSYKMYTLCEIFRGDVEKFSHTTFGTIFLAQDINIMIIYFFLLSVLL